MTLLIKLSHYLYELFESHWIRSTLNVGRISLGECLLFSFQTTFFDTFLIMNYPLFNRSSFKKHEGFRMSCTITTMRSWEIVTIRRFSPSLNRGMCSLRV